MSLKIGVLGASRIAELAIVGPAHDLGHRLVAVAARDRRRAQLFAEKHGVERVLSSYDDVVNDPDVDVVYNPLANALHAPWRFAAGVAGERGLAAEPLVPHPPTSTSCTTPWPMHCTRRGVWRRSWRVSRC